MTSTIHARRMAGFPETADRHLMPLARWYELDCPDPARGGLDHLVITNHGVYPCDSLGRLTDIDHALQERHVGLTPEAELSLMGYELWAVA